jgi:hypothetical protein
MARECQVLYTKDKESKQANTEMLEQSQKESACLLGI